MNPPINARIEFDEIIVPKVQEWVATNPNRGLDSEDFQKQYKVWSDEAAKTVRARAREDALAQMFEKKVRGVERIENEDGTVLFNTADESASEFADLYAEAYYNGDDETLKRLKWDEWSKNRHSKATAMAYGFMHEQAVAFEQMGAGIAAWAFGGSKDVRNDVFAQREARRLEKTARLDEFKARWESSERKVAEDFADQLGMTGERRSAYLADRFNREWEKYREGAEAPYWEELQRREDLKTEQARFAGREVAARIRAIGTLGFFGGQDDIVRGNVHEPTDLRKTRGRAGGGFFVKAAEMTGTATGVIPYSVPAMATRNPKAAAMLTTPFYAASAQGAYDDMLDIHRQQVAAAQELGLPEPAAPLRADVANYARMSGLIELGSEYTIDRLQLATLKGLAWGSKVKGTGMSPNQLAQAGEELAMSMRRRRGLTGKVKGAARFAAVAAQEGIEESVPAIGQEVLDPIFIPEGYQSDFWSWQTAEEVGVGTIAGALMAGGYTVFGKQPREERRRTAAIRKAVREGKSDFVGAAMKGRATRLGIERLAANSGRAMTEQMALAQLNDIERGRRVALVISPADADRVITPRVAEQMQAMGITARGKFGDGYLYAQQALEQDVMSAVAENDSDFLFGRPSLVEPNIPLSGAFVVRNAGGQIIDVMPYTDGNAADGVEASIAADVKADGLTYSRVDGDALADVESEMAQQMEAQAVASGAVKAGPRQPNEAQRRRGINSLTKQISQNAQGSLNDAPARQRDETPEQFAAREAAWSDAPYSNPMLSQEEIGEARNKDVKVEVVITEVPESALTGAEKLVSPTTGVKPTVLDAVVRFTITNPDGTTRVVEKSTDQDGAYVAQDTPDGVFLIRDTTGNPFTRRNAFVTAMHELRHRMGATSRSGAEYLGHLFWLDPEFALRGGIGYMMQNPRFAQDAAGLSEDEIVGRVAAAYGAALAVLEDKAGYAKAQRTLRDEDASAVEVEQAQSRVRQQEEAIETVKEVETFAEESVAATQTEGLGQVSQLAAEFETHYRNRRERSARAFMAWMSHFLSRRGYDGPQGQQAIYEIQQRHAGKVDSEMQVFEANRREAERKYKESLRRWQAQRPQQSASTATAPAAAGGMAAQPENAERGLAGGASFSRRPSKGAPKVVGAVGEEEREQGLAEATNRLTEAQRSLSSATTPEERSSALAGVVQALAKYMPYLAEASAQLGVTSKRTRGPQAAPPAQRPRARADTAQQPQAESALFGEVARPRADVKASGRRTLRGEWWLTESGPLFADGDVGDMNHEMLAQEEALRDFRNDLIRFAPQSSDAQLKRRIEEFDARLDDMLDNGIDLNEAQKMARSIVDNAETYDDLMDRLDVPQRDRAQFVKEAEAATGSVDPREYGLGKGWVRVQGNNIQLRRITDSALRGVADNLYQAEDEAVLDQVFTVEDVATRRVFEDVPFEALEKGITGLAPYRAQYSLRPIKRSEMTPEMAKWSEGSKVVDENGDLIPVYHGTDALNGFDAFRIGPVGEYGTGIYFTDQADAANEYAGTNAGAQIIPAVLSLKNPVLASKVSFYTDVARNLGMTRQEFMDKANKASREEGTTLADFVTDSLKSAGFDGVSVRVSPEERYFVAFEPNQAKGYFNERPTSSPQIMGSRRFDPFKSVNDAMRNKGFTPEQRLRLISAAASMSVDNAVVAANPIDWLRALQRNPAARTLTPYTIADLNRTAGQNLDTVKTQRQAAGNTAELQIPEDFDPSEPYMRPYRLNGVDAGFAVKRVLEFKDDGSVSFDGYEAVGLFSNDEDVATGIVAPTMLFLIGFNPDKPMRGDCYNVVRAGGVLGKLPTLYTRFGAVETWSFDFDPNYPDLGATAAERAAAVAKLEAVWSTPIGGNWKAERDAAGNITNYPSVWGFKFALTPDQRRKIANAGLSGYLENPDGIVELVEEATADSEDADQRADVERQVAGGVSGSQPVPVGGGAGGGTSGGRRLAGRNAVAGGGIFSESGGRTRVDLAKLSQEIKKAGEEIKKKRGTAQAIGRLLSASRLLPSSSPTATPENLKQISDVEQEIASLKRSASAPNISKDARKGLLKQAAQKSAQVRALREAYAGSMADILGLTSLRELGSTERRRRRKQAEQNNTGEVVRMGVAGLQERLDMYSRAVVNMVGEVVDRDGKLSEFMQNVMAESMVADMHYAMTKAGSHKNAAEWYKSVVDLMWKHVKSKYDVFGDPARAAEAEAVFSMILAITSNGEKVLANMGLTRKIFDNWLNTGVLRFPPNTSAKRGGSMSRTIETLDMVRKTMPNQTWVEVSDFLLRKDKFKNHNKALVKVRSDLSSQVDSQLASGAIDAAEAEQMKRDIASIVIQDSADDVGYMAAIIGPKIGSFFANLNGRWDTLTADVWFVRTFARIIANLQMPDSVATRSAIADIIASKHTDEATALGWSDEMIDSPDEILEWAKTVEDSYMTRRRAQQAANGTILEKTPLELAATRLTKAVVKSSAAPKSRSERSLMREITQKAIRIAKERYGHDIELASAQALLWYVEKELYETYAAGQDVAGQDFEQAAKAVFDQKVPVATGRAPQRDPVSGAMTVPAQFSMRRGAMGIKDEATIAFIDRFDELLRAQRVAERTSGALADPANPYLGARLLQGNIAAQQQEAERRYADLLRRQHVAGIAIDEMDEFLYAQHAQERNDYIAGIDPAMPDGGSGMTNSDAADIIAEAQRRGRFAQMNAFAEEWREMLREALEARLAAGLIRRDVYDAVTATYKNYVPLRGRAARDPWDADFEEVAPTYARGLSTTGRGMPQATGRRSAATGISAQVAYVHEDTIRRIARNDVGQRFLRLTQILADRRWTEVVRPTRRVVVGGRVRVVHDPSWTQDGRHFGVFLADAERIGGHDYAAGDLVVIRINNERLARAMLEPTMDLRWWERGLRVANNVWRMMTTGPLNPAFAPVNQFRDLGTATINNTLQRGAIDTLGMLRRYPRAFIRVMADEWNGQGPTGMYKEFTDAGGQQVYWKENDLDVKQTDFDALARRVARRDPKDRGLAKKWLGWYTAYFAAAETASRLAQYEQRIATGSTPQQAALAARDITVDFAKGGTTKPVLNTWYVFSNAALQGNANILTSLLANPVRSALTVPHLMLLGYAMSAMARAMSGDDEERGQTRWDSIPDYEKTTNLFIFDPRGSGKYLKVPMPYGWNVIVSAGIRLEQAAAGRTSGSDMLGGLFVDSLSAFNPIGGSGIKQGAEGVLTSFMPTMVRPLGEVVANRNFAGQPIYKEQLGRNRDPDAVTAFESTPEAYRKVAEFLNDATGGDRFESGMIDVSPDTLRYLAGYYASGTGRIMDRILTAATAPDGAELNDIPVLRSFMGDAANDRRSLAQQYYAVADNVAPTAKRIAAIQRPDSKEEYESAMASLDRTQIPLANLVNESEKELRRLRAASRGATKEQKERIAEVRRRVQSIVVRRANELDMPP